MYVELHVPSSIASWARSCAIFLSFEFDTFCCVIIFTRAACLTPFSFPELLVVDENCTDFLEFWFACHAGFSDPKLGLRILFFKNAVHKRLTEWYIILSCHGSPHSGGKRTRLEMGDRGGGSKSRLAGLDLNSHVSWSLSLGYGL